MALLFPPAGGLFALLDVFEVAPLLLKLGPWEPMQPGHPASTGPLRQLQVQNSVMPLVGGERALFGGGRWCETSAAWCGLVHEASDHWVPGRFDALPQGTWLLYEAVAIPSAQEG